MPRLHSSATSLQTTALLEKVFPTPGIRMLKGFVKPTFSKAAPPLAVPNFFPGNKIS